MYNNTGDCDCPDHNKDDLTWIFLLSIINMALALALCCSCIFK